MRGQSFIVGTVGEEARNDPARQFLPESLVDVIGHIAARQGVSGDVDVGVDKSGCDDKPAPVNDLIRFKPRCKLLACSHGGDPVSPNRESAVPQDAPLRVHRDNDRPGNDRAQLLRPGIRGLAHGVFPRGLSLPPRRR